MYLPKIRELKEALISLFSKPYTTGFPKTKFDAAEEYRGKPRYNPEYCVGCAACAQVCPADAISVSDDLNSRMRSLTVSYFKCINCGQCEENCTTEFGIKLTNEYSFATMNTNDPNMFEKIEKRLVVSEISGKAIGCEDHLMFVKQRLGGKAYAHPNFMLLTQNLFFNVEPSKAKPVIRREDHIKYVTSKERYQIVVADEF